jgi:hypothetical protein
MSKPTHISSFLYPVVKDIFVRYLQNKHQMPYKDIQVKDLSDADLLRWKSIENLNNVKLGVNLGDVKRNIVH